MSSDGLTWNSEEWVYAGTREGAKGKPLDTYHKVDDMDATFCLLRTRGKPTIPAAVGNVYSVELGRNEAGEAKLWRSNSVKYLRRFASTDRVIAWQLEDAEARDELRRQKKNAAAKKVDALAEALEPLRTYYMNSRNPHTRAAILAEVIVRITSWRKS